MVGEIGNAIPGAMLFLVPIVGSVSLFTFLAVWSWAEERRKEREAYYRYELGKKVLETGGTPEQLAALFREEETLKGEKRREREFDNRKMSGLVTLAVGFGLVFGLRFTGEPVWMIGYIPIAIGVALLLSALLSRPRRIESASESPARSAGGRAAEHPRG